MEILISPYSKPLRDGKRNPKNWPYWNTLIRSLKSEGHRVVQVGQGSEEKLQGVDAYVFDRPFSELKTRIHGCDLWISVDNFFHHLGASIGKKGIVLWGQSDPEIFGHPGNLNLLKDRKYLRLGVQQFWLWEQCDYQEEAFVGPEVVLKAVREWKEVPKTSYSVVIPTFNHFDVFSRCMKSLFRWTNFANKKVEIVVVANGCTDQTVSWCKSLDQSAVKVLEFPKAMGYTVPTNIGVKASSGDYVVLLNNDTEVLGNMDGKDWLEGLQEPFLRDEKVGATGIKTLHQLGITFLVGFCWMLKRETLERFNYLDEAFSPGWGEDIDFCKKLQNAGLKLEVCPVNLSHQGEATVWDDRDPWEENVQKNIKILQERYPQ